MTSLTFPPLHRQPQVRFADVVIATVEQDVSLRGKHVTCQLTRGLHIFNNILHTTTRTCLVTLDGAAVSMMGISPLLSAACW